MRDKRARVALIDEARCIGCARCLEACPVDAIAGASGLMHTVIAPLCIGCDLCERWCPWDAIEMIVPTKIAEAVARKGGPEDYVAAQGEKLYAVAKSIQDLAVELAAAAPAKK